MCLLSIYPRMKGTDMSVEGDNMPCRTWCRKANSLHPFGRISEHGSLERGGCWCGCACTHELSVGHWRVFGLLRHLCLSLRLVCVEGGVSA